MPRHALPRHASPSRAKPLCFFLRVQSVEGNPFDALTYAVNYLMGFQRRANRFSTFNPFNEIFYLRNVID